MTVILLKSEANNGRKRRSRQHREDLVVAERLSTKPRKLTKMREKIKLHPVIDGHTPAEPEDQPESLSHDVIFVPSTQTTRYSAARAAKTNLQRRMPGYDVSVSYGSGEGTLTFTASTSVEVPVGDYVVHTVVNAECIASASDMAIRNIRITAGEAQEATIEPASHPMSPEDALRFIDRVVTNYVRNNGS